MLRLAGARRLNERDYPVVRTALAADPVGNCMVSARVEAGGLDPLRLGGQLWTVGSKNSLIDSLCFSGPNLVPLSGDRSAWRGFADRALREQRFCSSLVGHAKQVLGLWDELALEWGPAREVRPDQPLMALCRPAVLPPDPRVRLVRPDELDQYFPAAVAMFVEEVGADPRLGDGGASYRARVAELIAARRAFAVFDGGQVLFKAEIGALSGSVGQIQGVWVHPEHRGRGLGSAGMAAVVNRIVRGMGRTASLYVNGYNTAALATYHKVGFRQVGQYATVLF